MMSTGMMYSSIGAWCAIVATVTGVGVLLGMSITIGTAALVLGRGPRACDDPAQGAGGCPITDGCRSAPRRRPRRLIITRRRTNWEALMSERNGDRTRFQTQRKRKLCWRQRIQRLIKTLRAHTRRTETQ